MINTVSFFFFLHQRALKINDKNAKQPLDTTTNLSVGSKNNASTLQILTTS